MLNIPAAVEFTETINLGAVILTVLGVGAALFFTVRSNVAKYWREVAEAEQRRVVQLSEKIVAMVPKETLDACQAECEEQRRLKHEAISEAAGLRLTRDLTPLIRAQQDLMGRVVSMEEQGESRYAEALREVKQLFTEHETRAQERHEEQINAMRIIADRLADGR